MRLIDAYSGSEMVVGGTYRQPDGSIRIIDITPGLLSATARVQKFTTDAGGAMKVVVDVPLIVRYTHPKYFLQHVAFFPS